MTRKTKAADAEMSTQCFLAVENMIRQRILVNVVKKDEGEVVLRLS